MLLSGVLHGCNRDHNRCFRCNKSYSGHRRHKKLSEISQFFRRQTNFAYVFQIALNRRRAHKQERVHFPIVRPIAENFYPLQSIPLTFIFKYSTIGAKKPRSKFVRHFDNYQPSKADTKCNCKHLLTWSCNSMISNTKCLSIEIVQKSLSESLGWQSSMKLISEAKLWPTAAAARSASTRASLRGNSTACSPRNLSPRKQNLAVTRRKTMIQLSTDVALKVLTWSVR